MAGLGYLQTQVSAPFAAPVLTAPVLTAPPMPDLHCGGGLTLDVVYTSKSHICARELRSR